MTIVELIALPGAGKTTLYSALSKSRPGSGLRLRLQEEVVLQAALPHRLWVLLAIGFWLLPSLRANKVVRSVATALIPSAYHRSIKMGTSDAIFGTSSLIAFTRALSAAGFRPRSPVERVNWFIRNLMAFDLCGQQSGLVILDEGLVQRAHSLAMEGAPQSEVLEYLSTLPRSTICVHLCLPNEARIARLGGREGDNRERFSVDGETDAMSVILEYTRQIGIRVIELDASLMPSEIASNLIEHLSKQPMID